MASVDFLFPRSVRIGGLDVKVHWEHSSVEGELFGSYLGGPPPVISLYLDKCTSEKLAWSTLIHEMSHASLDIGGVSYVLAEEKEEAVVRNHDSLLIPSLRSLIRRYPNA